MSVHLDHGYRVNLGPYGGNLLAFHARLIEAFTDTFTDLYLRTAVSAAVCALDRLRLDGKPARYGDDHDHLDEVLLDPGSPLLWADQLMQHKQAQVTTSGRRDPAFDVAAEVAYLGGPDDPGVAYLLLYAEQDAYRTVLGTLLGVAGYGYRNNTDDPDQLTPRDRSARSATWNRLLGSGTPAATGLTWAVGPDRGPVMCATSDDDTVAGYVPDDDTRAETLARQVPLSVPDSDERPFTDTRGRLDMAALRAAMDEHRAVTVPRVRAVLKPVPVAALRLHADDPYR